MLLYVFATSSILGCKGGGYTFHSLHAEFDRGNSGSVPTVLAA
jgi:hypothetical protein